MLQSNAQVSSCFHLYQGEQLLEVRKIVIQILVRVHCSLTTLIKKTAKPLIDENTKKYLCTYAESVLLRFTNETTTKRLENHLVSIEFTSIHFLFSLLLERNNNKSYEHIKKEERKYDDEANVVKRHLNLIVFYRSLILFCCVDCVIHSSADKYGEY